MSEEKLRLCFPMGEKRCLCPWYFVGQSYLKMLTTEGVAIGNVTFDARLSAIIGISIIKAGRYCLSQADEVIIRSGGNRPGVNCG